jgi:uncharacterized DUF497 family protein
VLFDWIIWDLEDDPNGNVQHCAEHGFTKEEVSEVLQNATDADISRTSGRPVVFGDTRTGRHLMVVFEEIDPDTINLYSLAPAVVLFHSWIISMSWSIVWPAAEICTFMVVFTLPPTN